MSLLTPVVNEVTQSLNKVRSRSFGGENLEDLFIPPSGTVSKIPNDTTVTSNDTQDLSKTHISSSLAEKWWYESEEEGALKFQ